MNYPAPISSDGQVWCPLCSERFPESDYLRTVIQDEKTLWIANMITHYRHTHITSWNKMWGNRGSSYRKAAHFGDYEEEKRKVNERAKRQILRQASGYMLTAGILCSHFEGLQHNDIGTLRLAASRLNGKLQHTQINFGNQTSLFT